MTVPHATMIVGSQIDGRNFFKSRFEGTSKAQYVKKKTVTGKFNRQSGSVTIAILCFGGNYKSSYTGHPS